MLVNDFANSENSPLENICNCSRTRDNVAVK